MNTYKKIILALSILSLSAQSSTYAMFGFFKKLYPFALRSLERFADGPFCPPQESELIKENIENIRQEKEEKLINKYEQFLLKNKNITSIENYPNAPKKLQDYMKKKFFNLTGKKVVLKIDPYVDVIEDAATCEIDGINYILLSYHTVKIWLNILEGNKITKDIPNIILKDLCSNKKDLKYALNETILHECGHIKYNHSNTINALSYASNKKIYNTRIKYELEADQYAIDNTKTKTQLKAVIQVHKNFSTKYGEVPIPKKPLDYITITHPKYTVRIAQYQKRIDEINNEIIEDINQQLFEKI